MSVISTINEYKREYAYNKRVIEDAERVKKTLINKLEEASNNKELFDNIVFATKLIIEKITYESKSNVEDYLTYALRSIFTDREYSIKLNLKEDTKKPGLELTLVDGSIEQEITDAVGGGILSTVGLLLQIYYIEVFDVNKIIFIDEGLKEISSTKSLESETEKSYLDNMLSFLKWLASEKEYKIIIVTHDNKVKSYADKVYEVSKGVVTEC